MSNKRGFLEYKRALPSVEEPKDRLSHFKEFVLPSDGKAEQQQAARCMDCGVPFCHNACPLGNVIPDFNEAVYEENWRLAYEVLSSTNNFPEFTGRICPAPCEASCVLGINSDPVTIEYVEKTIVEKAFKLGYVQAKIPVKRTGKKVAVVGSGPAGLACADQLNQQGHAVTVFEKKDRIGGLLRYGIPDFKLEKNVIDRRINLLQAEGITFKTNVNIGVDMTTQTLLDTFDAVVLCGGSDKARNLDIEGRDLKGIHFAMDFLEQCNRMVAGDAHFSTQQIDVKGKKIVVIGGGDTGSDCIGNANRLQADTITQIELLGKPPVQRSDDNPWPLWPMTLKTTSSHKEGCDRTWAMLTKRFLSEDGVHLSGIEVVEVKWDKDTSGRYQMQELPNTSQIIPCDVVFLAMGFLHPKKQGLLEELNLALDKRGNVHTQNFNTSVDKIFSAGDMRRGQSLVVWAIAEGRDCAVAVDDFLRSIPVGNA